MMALDVVFGIWALVLIAIGSISAVLGTRYFKKGKEYHDMQKQLLIEAETRVKRQYNKIAMLSVKDLNTYLAGIFARYMELNGELNTTRDNLVYERLFAEVQADVLTFIGDETLAAIEYYYGEGYVEKWSKLAFLILEKRRKIGGVVDGTTNYEDLENLLATEMYGGTT